MRRLVLRTVLPLSLLAACGGSPDGVTEHQGTRNQEAAAQDTPQSGVVEIGEGGAAGGSSDEVAGAGAGVDAAGAAGAADEPEGAAGAGGEGGGGGEPQGHCGDGVQQGAEACDDGNDVRGDGCNPDCGLSGRVLDNTIEYKEFSQSLEAAVLIGNTLYAVGSSAESAGDAAKLDKLFVSADLTATALAPSSLVSGNAGKDDLLTRITTDGSALFAGGKVEVSDASDALVERRSLGGAVQWTRTWNGSHDFLDEASGVAVVGSQLFAVGFVTNAATGEDMFLSKLSRTNAKAPITTYVSSPGFKMDGAEDIAPYGTGAIIAGKIWTETGRDIWLRRVDSSMNTVWTTTWKDIASVSRIAVAPDGRIALAGGTGDSNDLDSWVGVFDDSGAHLWSKAFDHGGKDYATGVAFDPDNGDLILCGAVEDHNWDPYVQRLSPDGDERWFTTFDGSGHDDRAEAVTLGEDGTIWAVGSWGTGADDSDYWIGRFAP